MNIHQYNPVIQIAKWLFIVGYLHKPMSLLIEQPKYNHMSVHDLHEVEGIQLILFHP